MKPRTTQKKTKPAEAAAVPAPPPAIPPKDSPDTGLPSLIVAVGGGVGSEHAFTQMLARLRSGSGMAFLYVSSGAREGDRTSLANASILSVVEVKERTLLRRECIYVAPPNCTLILVDGGNAVKSLALSPSGRRALKLDPLFRSVATEGNVRAAGVLLSGQGSDGVLGLREMKAEGGIILVQDEGSATQSELIAKALSSGLVDCTFPPRRIGEELVRVSEQLDALGDGDGSPETAEDQPHYTKIYALLRALTGVDFTYYKPTTLKRRIDRRMVVIRVQSLEEYVRFLQKNPGEADRLFQDILINVTSFFRDPPVFQALKKRVLPKIFRRRDAQSPVRIWIPGCSTGEEVYSIAIAILEYLAPGGGAESVQLFATDISEAALAKARNGIYPESISSDVSPERLRRYFHRTTGGYQISKKIRELCVFARQNLFEDPPFSKLDLISCRNVLIYLGPQLQKKVIPIFHYALNSSGHLLLGSSETIGLFSNLFTVLDKRNKIYQKAVGALRQPMNFSAMTRNEEASAPSKRMAPRLPAFAQFTDIGKHVDRLLLSQYAPAGLVVNSSLEVLQFRGQTGPFLEPAPGEASLHLVKLVREGIAMDLRSMVSRSLKMDVVTRKDGVTYMEGSVSRAVTIEVIPFRNPPSKDRFLLILFTEVPPAAPDATPTDGKARASGPDRETLRLREELSATKESLQAIIEEQEATNEELKSANEEIQSSNEELQSTNEEMETTKEELQSTNEELTTLNEELQSRNAELSQVNNDFSNLLTSANLPIIILGNDLTIRRFTPMAERHFNLIQTDVGRRITDIKPNIAIHGMEQRVSAVIETLKIQEHELQDNEGRWYSLRIRPYRTSDNKIDGAVLILVDINEIRRGLEEISDMVTQPVLILTGDFRLHHANHAFYETYKINPAVAEGMPISEVGQGSWNIPGLRALLEGVLPEKRRVEEFRLEHDFPKIGRKELLINARVLQQESKGTQLILLTICDVTADA